MPSLIMSAPFSNAAPKSAPLKKIQLSESSGSLERGSDTNTFKCLLVDDNVDLLEMTADLFRDAGFEVFTAVSGKEALQILKSNPSIDAVLTDVVMPGMSGLELGHEVRKHYPSISVILVSGYPNPASVAGHGSVHHFPFVQKPYRTDQVIRLLIKTN
ncbi:response regulator [Noviherbaspirillum sp. 1P10PC]|uniref:response regulator n=1 Tax=Noviherbaspirillum sp. 1P10PC TaxID=3132292 RepID=UPI0039A3395E